MTSQKKAKLMGKIKALFALAENNPSEEEASAALAQAKKLLIQYQIDEMDLERFSAEQDGKTQDAFEPGCVEVRPPQSRFHAWIKLMVNAVADFYDVSWCFYSGNTFAKIPPRILFYGVKTNCEVAGVAFHSVYEQIMKLSKRYKPSHADFEDQCHYTHFAIFSTSARQEYREGVAAGVQKRVRNEKRKQEEEFGQKCTALAVRAKDVSDQYAKDAGWKFTVARSKAHGTYGTGTDARWQGAQDSDKVDLQGRRGLGSTKTKGNLR